MKPIKKGFLKRALKSVFQSPVIRGLIKSLPFGNVGYEVAENIIGETVNQTKKDENGNVINDKPHSAISLLCQFVVLALIVWAFVTKQIAIEDVLNLLGVTADDFKSYTEPTITIIKDTLN